MVYIEDTVIFRITDSLWGMPFNIDLITVGDVNTRLKIPYYVYRHIDRHGTTGTSSSRGTVNGVRDFTQLIDELETIDTLSIQTYSIIYGRGEL